ncbi:diguanylate cyclase [Sinorhizobium fredii USDA 205]|uniref:EAL domain-containing protein n=2 Tax=Rhizobium fredii TaxID=380 RepID=A0A844ACL8_RHIFR|nr:EAL domain-containing protein [Sinorhizobium fredii]AWM25960.1 diguanylate cyclase/phosphodiesterase (GGDEF & EAL domains) with PAS/PAC sensor(s) [Sinorhizobium fredii CCBAU 25509]KSV91696.1 diguanylate cyclase [Sinorhizobium fredii USDA 205]MQW99270.1 EAL domain-containing protein [Sinorhizobium fredii]MQX09240.1 EAL domain-containing protein [Sinorhizobium fredii]UTY50080.1 GGDEF and EAL domain-containing protein [Sinorhizobium fredii]
MFSVISCISDRHDWRLVAVAAIVCLAGSAATMLLLQRAERSQGWRRHLWTAACAFACGVGVWSTHFIAMLAYDGGVPIAYDAWGTLFSALVAVVASGIAFATALVGTSRYIFPGAGIFLGLGIAAMHVTGMRAVEVQGRIDFDPQMGFAAVLFGPLIAALALHAFQVLEGARKLIVPTLLLVLAICVLHFTSMSGVTLVPDPSVAATDAFDPVWLAGGVVVASTTLILTALGALFIDRHLTDLRGLANASLEGMVIVCNGRIIDANERFVGLYGAKAADLIGRKPEELFASSQGRERQIDNGSAEVELIAADGRLVPVEHVSRTIEYRGRQSDVIFVRDLSARKEAERTIEHLAHHDALTDLSNRSSFERRLSQALTVAAARNEQLAIFCLDLDRFKAVNDIFGHAEGDRILRKVADILRAAAGDADTIARLGGDEFAILQTGAAQPEAARQLSDRILRIFAEEMDTHRDPMAVGVSMGVAVYPCDGTTAERLCNNADTALYRAKQTGKGIACFFDAEMDDAVRSRRQMESDLRHAILRRQLFLEYQPLVDVGDDRVVGYEALLRWRHPERGLVGPNVFIPIAEESGSIIQIGEWVLEEACAEAVRWTEPLPVSVNISPVQFLVPSLFDQIAGILRRTGLEPRRLELELTEAALMHNREDVLAALVRLRLLGVRIVMDDFGTGHSSLANLQTFPFDKLKIDCSFTAALDKDPAAHAIIRAIIALGHSLDLPVVTEGVETERQKQIIVGEGCRQIQGFLTGRPGVAPSAGANSLSDAPALQHAEA